MKIKHLLVILTFLTCFILLAIWIIDAVDSIATKQEPSGWYGNALVYKVAVYKHKGDGTWVSEYMDKRLPNPQTKAGRLIMMYIQANNWNEAKRLTRTIARESDKIECLTVIAELSSHGHRDEADITPQIPQGIGSKGKQFELDGGPKLAPKVILQNELPKQLPAAAVATRQILAWAASEARSLENSLEKAELMFLIADMQQFVADPDSAITRKAAADSFIASQSFWHRSWVYIINNGWVLLAAIIAFFTSEYSKLIIKDVHEKRKNRKQLVEHTSPAEKVTSSMPEPKSPSDEAKLGLNGV